MPGKKKSLVLFSGTLYPLQSFDRIGCGGLLFHLSIGGQVSGSSEETEALLHGEHKFLSNSQALTLNVRSIPPFTTVVEPRPHWEVPTIVPSLVTSLALEQHKLSKAQLSIDAIEVSSHLKQHKLSI
jgi:hypothetical protein